MLWSIIREPADGIAEVRISLGKPRNIDAGYLVFRGTPEGVIKLLEDALASAKEPLLGGHYDDKRGRPQG